MNTLIESPLFQKQAAAVWTEQDYLDFTFWIAQNPQAGDVVKGTHPAARKVRWSRQGAGKSGGVRVIYYYLDEENAVYLSTVYAKAATETLSAKAINQLAKGI
jgi:mRNA-degrading endonuclease RelE of RelBE toxin-antitoxin system